LPALRLVASANLTRFHRTGRTRPATSTQGTGRGITQRSTCRLVARDGRLLIPHPVDVDRHASWRRTQKARLAAPQGVEGARESAGVSVHRSEPSSADTQLEPAPRGMKMRLGGSVRVRA
jgi:hypothetical protein